MSLYPIKYSQTSEWYTQFELGHQISCHLIAGAHQCTHAHIYTYDSGQITSNRFVKFQNANSINVIIYCLRRVKWHFNLWLWRARAIVMHIHINVKKRLRNLPYVTLPSTTVVIILPFFEIFVIFVRSAERERCVRVLDGDDERCDERDDGLGNEFRPSFTLNFTLNIFVFVFCFDFSLK